MRVLYRAENISVDLNKLKVPFPLFLIWKTGVITVFVLYGNTLLKRRSAVALVVGVIGVERNSAAVLHLFSARNV